MATKPYPPIEETPSVAKENHPNSIYKPTPYEMESIRRAEEDYKAGRVYTQEEVDKMVAQWLGPLTDEEIDEIFGEAEADDEADRLLSSDSVYDEMERLNPWLNK